MNSILHVNYIDTITCGSPSNVESGSPSNEEKKSTILLDKHKMFGTLQPRCHTTNTGECCLFIVRLPDDENRTYIKSNKILV